MTPDQAVRIMQIYEETTAEKLVYLRRAHKAEQAAIIWKALAITGWSILIFSAMSGVLT